MSSGTDQGESRSDEPLRPAAAADIRWEGGEPPEARFYHSATLVPHTGEVIVMGGFVRDNPKRMCCAVPIAITLEGSLDQSVFSCRTLTAPAPAKPWPAVCWHTTALLPDNRLLIFGGRSSENRMLNLSYLLNLETNAWKLARTTGMVPDARAGHCMHRTREQSSEYIVFGGMKDGGLECHNDVFIFDADKMSWRLQEVTGSLPPPRYVHASTCVGNRLWVFGGLQGPLSRSIPCSDLWYLDLHTWRWHQPECVGPPPPSGPYKMVRVPGFDSIVVWGKPARKSSLQLFHLMTVSVPNADGKVSVTWRSGLTSDSAPLAYEGHTMVAYEGLMYVIGGRPGLPQGDASPTLDVCVVDPAHLIPVSLPAEETGGSSPPPISHRLAVKLGRRRTRVSESWYRSDRGSSGERRSSSGVINVVSSPRKSKHLSAHRKQMDERTSGEDAGGGAESGGGGGGASGAAGGGAGGSGGGKDAVLLKALAQEHLRVQKELKQAQLRLESERARRRKVEATLGEVRASVNFGDDLPGQLTRLRKDNERLSGLLSSKEQQRGQMMRLLTKAQGQYERELSTRLKAEVRAQRAQDKHDQVRDDMSTLREQVTTLFQMAVAEVGEGDARQRLRRFYDDMMRQTELQPLGSKHDEGKKGRGLKWRNKLKREELERHREAVVKINSLNHRSGGGLPQVSDTKSAPSPDTAGASPVQSSGTGNSSVAGGDAQAAESIAPVLPVAVAPLLRSSGSHSFIQRARIGSRRSGTTKKDALSKMVSKEGRDAQVGDDATVVKDEATTPAQEERDAVADTDAAEEDCDVHGVDATESSDDDSEGDDAKEDKDAHEGECKSVGEDNVEPGEADKEGNVESNTEWLFPGFGTVGLDDFEVGNGAEPEDEGSGDEEDGDEDDVYPRRESASALLESIRSHYQRRLTSLLVDPAAPGNAGASPEDAVALEAKKARQFNNLVTELVDSERSYVVDMKILVTSFRRPLLGEHAVVTPHDVFCIFSNVEDVYTENTKLLGRLKRENTRPAEEQCWGDALLEFVTSAAAAYTRYASRKAVSNATVDSLYESNRKFAAFHDAATKLPQCAHVSGLKSLLIKPVQRLCKYPLLLQGMLDNLPASMSASAKSLEAAIHAFRDALDSVESQLVMQDSKLMIMELESTLDWLRDPPLKLAIDGRELLMDADVLMNAASVNGEAGDSAQRFALRRMHMYLFNDLLVISHRKSKKATEVLELVLPLEYCVLIAVRGRNAFQVVQPEQDLKYLFVTSSRQQTESWTRGCAKAIKEARKLYLS